jgi:hypothetical protein
MPHMSGVQIARILLDIDATAETRAWRTKAMTVFPGGPVTVPSQYVLDIGRALSLTLADEATVRMIRDACDQLLTLPAPEEIHSMLPAPADDAG